MAISQSSNGLGNILRLQGLKNVAGRRRVLGNVPMLEDLNNAETDIAGTAPETMPPPAPNMPEPERGGELTSQSYDVRANQIMPPETVSQQAPQEQAFWTKLGHSLANITNRSPLTKTNPVAEPGQYLPQFAQVEPKIAELPSEATPQVPPIETQQVDMAEGLPPVSASEEETINEPYGMVGWTKKGNLLTRNAPAQAPALNVEELPKTEKEVGTKAVPGAVNEVIMNPELKSEMERVFGLPLTPEMTQQLSDMEAALRGYTDSLQGAQTNLSEHQKYLQEKIANRDLSPRESIFMAMSVIAPALVMGLMAGKEGAIAGLAGGAQAAAANLVGREEGIEEAYKLNTELGKQGMELGMKGLEAQQMAADLKTKAKKYFPNPAIAQLYTDVGGGMIDGKPVFNTGDPLLPLKTSAVRRPEDYDQFMKVKKPELENRLRYTQGGLKNLDALEKIIDYAQALEKHEWLPGEKGFNKFSRAFAPATRWTYPDANGNPIKLELAYQTEMQQLTDAYANALAAVGTKGAAEGYRGHVLEQAPNPFTAGAFLKGETQLNTTRHQIQQMKKKFESDITNTLNLSGVETSPIKELFKSMPSNARASESTRKKNRAEQAAQEVIQGKK